MRSRPPRPFSHLATLLFATTAAAGDADPASIVSHFAPHDFTTELRDVNRSGDVTAIAADGDWLVIGMPDRYDDTIVQDVGAVEIYHRTGGAADPHNGWRLVQTILSPSKADGQRFGGALDLRGDLLVVGAPGHTGRAYVFRPDDSTDPPQWVQTESLSGPNTRGDGFGGAVCIGDGFVAIGAPSASETFVFPTGGADAFQSPAKLEREPGAWSRRFGIAIATSGKTLAIGETPDAGLASGGRVHIFEQAGDDVRAWTRRGILDRMVDDSDGFGVAVTMDEDTLVVGATLYEEPVRYAGAAFVYRRDEASEQGWTEEAVIQATGYDDFMYLGLGVTLSDGVLVVRDRKLHRDGYGTLYFYQKPEPGGTWRLLGHYRSSDEPIAASIGNGVCFRGHDLWLTHGVHPNFDLPAAVHIPVPFGNATGASVTTGPVLEVVPETAVTLDTGHLTAVDLSLADQENLMLRLASPPALGTLSHGGNTLTVGDSFPAASVRTGEVTYQAGAATGSEALRLEAWTPGGAPGHPAMLRLHVNHPSQILGGGLETTARDDRFGYQVAIAGAVAVAGAPLSHVEIEGGARLSDAGLAYVYARTGPPGAPWEIAATLASPDPEVSAYFGHAVATDGDSVVIGSWTADGRYRNSGVAYVFRRGTPPDTGWQHSATLEPSDPVGSGNFGYAVSVDGSTLAVSAVDALPQSRRTGDGIGAVYTFERDPADPDTWTETARLGPDDNVWNVEFGYAVKLVGDTLVASDYSAFNGSGRVYVSERDPAAGTWGPLVELEAPRLYSFGRFGTSIDLEDDLLAVGQPRMNYGRLETGVVHVFRRDRSGPEPAWTLTDTLTAGPGALETEERFGRAVAFADGDLYVGAYYNEGEVPNPRSAGDKGAVYHFRQSWDKPGAWKPFRTLYSWDEDGVGAWQFGRSIAAADGALIVSAHAAYVRDFTPGGRAYVFDLPAPAPGEPESALVATGDLDADGTPYPLELFLGTDPLSADHPPSAPLFAAGELTGLQVRADPAGDNPFVDAYLEGSDDCVNWDVVPGATWTAAADGWWKFRDPEPAKRAYYRLRATLVGAP